MNVSDKELWLVRHGSISTFGGSENVESHMEWVSWGRQHTVSVYHTGDEAISHLYDKVKDSLYSIVEHVEIIR